MARKALVRHPFLYELFHPATAKRVVKKAWAKVFHGTQSVFVTLTAAHVRRSIKRRGAGSTAECPMAFCVMDHQGDFSHKCEGHLDFNATRAWVASYADKQGLPARCYAYEHSAGWIADLNDEGLSGQKKLLAKIENDGPITVELMPIRVRSRPGRSGTGRKPSGARGKPKGAALRMFKLKLGGRPQAA